MQKFLMYLEPRIYLASEFIQEQNEEVYEVLFIMKGKVGVGYRLFNSIHYGKILMTKNVVNDYAMLRDKMSEFTYKPINDQVEGLCMRRENWVCIFKLPFFNKIYARNWCDKYI